MPEEDYNMALLRERMWGAQASKDAAVKIKAAASQAAVKIYGLLTIQEAADECRVSVCTFRKWPVKRFEDRGVVRIRRQDLEEFIASRVIDPAASPATIDGQAPQLWTIWAGATITFLGDVACR